MWKLRSVLELFKLNKEGGFFFSISFGPGGLAISPKYNLRFCPSEVKLHHSKAQGMWLKLSGLREESGWVRDSSV